MLFVAQIGWHVAQIERDVQRGRAARLLMPMHPCCTHLDVSRALQPLAEMAPHAAPLGGEKCLDKVIERWP